MQIKKYAACAVLGMMSLFTANAQDIMPEALPTRPTAERIVKEVTPVSVSFQSEPVQTTEANSVSYNATFGENVVQTALQYLGASYRLGTNGPTVFDCSGFTSYVYGKQNVSILRTSRSQYTQGTPIARISDLKKGDLVFFGGRGNARSVGHVGIVKDVDPSGNNFSFVHASIKGVKVSNSSEAYYSRRYIGARRIVQN
uniref:C40 family peptidase n=1 Tax=Alloprevotella sp. TaxID=1872471 RepID=UPI003FF0326B